MQTPQTTCPKLPYYLTVLYGLRKWYRAWVQMREARYRYLAAILDDTPQPRESHVIATAWSDDDRNQEQRDGPS